MKLSFRCILLLIFISAQNIYGETLVNSNITQNTTWSKANSPYIVTEDISVYHDATLTIEPGVIIKFNENKKLIVGHQLVANGHQDEMIVFTSNKSSPSPGDWSGIDFINESIDCNLDNDGNYLSGCFLKHCMIQYASCAINCEESSPYIYCNKIMNNNCGIYSESHDPSGINACPQIINNTITNNSGSLSGGGIHVHNGTPIIQNNTILNNTAETGAGIVTTQSYSISSVINLGQTTIRNNLINGNTVTHECSTPDPCEDYSRGGGIYLSGPAIIENNIITENISTGNLGGGIHIVSARDIPVIDYISMSYNNIFNNSGYDIYRSGPGKLSVPNNYWGTVDTGMINENIFDYYDNIECGEIDYETISESQYKRCDFIVNIVSGSTQSNVSFTCKFIGAVDSIEWDFGDGQTSFDINPIHTYSKSGSYNVAMYVTSPDGNFSEMKTDYIKINESGSSGGGGGCFISSYHVDNSKCPEVLIMLVSSLIIIIRRLTINNMKNI